mgnify:CR=1 FL=1
MQNKLKIFFIDYYSGLLFLLGLMCLVITLIFIYFWSLILIFNDVLFEGVNVLLILSNTSFAVLTLTTSLSTNRLTKYIDNKLNIQRKKIVYWLPCFVFIVGGFLVNAQFNHDVRNQSTKIIPLNLGVLLIILSVIAILLIYFSFKRANKILSLLHSSTKLPAILVGNAYTEELYQSTIGGGMVSYQWSMGSKIHEGFHAVWRTKKAYRLQPGSTIQVMLNPNNPSYALPYDLYSNIVSNNSKPT